MTDKNINIECKNPLLLVIVSLYWQLYCNLFYVVLIVMSFL